MSSPQRKRKPVLERSEPIRNWSTLFEAPAEDAEQAQAARGTSAAQDAGASLSEVVSRSVDLGYRVVDEYIRRGQQAAQRISDRSYDVQAMTSDAQDLGSRTLQYASDFASVWFDLFQRAAADSAVLRPKARAEDAGAAAAGATGSGPSASARSEPATGATQRPLPVRVKIEVTAAQPAEITLDLQPEATGLRLIVHALRAVDPTKARLSDVGFRQASDGQSPTLWIKVPADQPAGVYSGVIVDEQSSRPVGILSVRIAAES